MTAQWRRRYRAAVALLKERGISTTSDPRRGEERYVELRRQWDANVFAFARYMEHPPDEIDPVGANPAETGEHREMPVPELRAAG